MNAVSVSRTNTAATRSTPTQRSNYGAVAVDEHPRLTDVEEIVSGSEKDSRNDEGEDEGDSSCASMSGSSVSIRSVSRRDKSNANNNDISNHSLISQGTSSSHSYLSAGGGSSGSGGRSSDSSDSTDSSRHNYPSSRHASSPSIASGYEAVGDSVLQGMYATIGMALPFTSAFSGSSLHRRVEHEGDVAAEGSESWDEENGRDASFATTRSNSGTLFGVVDGNPHNTNDTMK